VKTRIFGNHRRFAAIITNLAFVFLCVPLVAGAQETLPPPEDLNEPQGFIAEPDIMTRVAIFADRHMGKGDLTNGWYVDFGKMVPGAGWLSLGPGYRQWFGKDTMLFDASAGLSWNGYRTAQARIALPKFANSRLALGTQLRWVDFGAVDYFGVGPDTPETALTQFGIQATHLAGHATLRLTRWLNVDTEIGLLSPTLDDDSALVRSLPSEDQPMFMPAQIAIGIDTRNFREHPTMGMLLRGAATHFDDRDTGAFTHRRYEGEFAGFVPMAGERMVLALRGWIVTTPRDDNTSVPFYMLPSLGGSNTLRSYADYRFHDRNMLVANAELRLAMMTHVDLALFADAGNVAPRIQELDLDKQSYGAGLRFHTRRQTFARVDLANGREGWRLLFRLTDPFAFNRLEKRASVVPSVP
jgi:hypothetical protein